MKVYKKVLSWDSGLWILCAWDICDKPGVELYKARVKDQYDPVTGEWSYIQYVFCSERHKMYWVNSHVRYGVAPAGYGNTL